MPSLLRQTSIFISTVVFACAFVACGGGGGGDAPPPAPVVNLSLSAASIVAGQGATLTWSASNAISCTASGPWTGSQPLSGNLSVSPAAGSHTYTLNCTGAGGSSSSAATLTVNPPPVVTIALTSDSITAGQSTTLSWSATNATACSASGAWAGSQPLSGSLSVSPVAGSHTYTLSCTGVGGSASGSATVNVNPPPVVTIAIDPSTITAGQSATLSWSASNATACSASGAWAGSQSLTGSLSVAPAAGSYSYTLNCTGAGGSSSGTATLTVGGAMVPAPVVFLSVSPGDIAAGQSATLNWTASNATACSASGAWIGGQPLSGSQTVSPSAGTHTYTLNCTGAGGSTSSTATLVVNPPPVVSVAVSPGSIAAGESATLNWSSSNATACTASGAWTGSRALTGSLAVTPVAGTHTYTLNCTGAGGSSSGTATLVVNPPPVVTISVSPASIVVGQSATLTWSAINATSCTASGPWSGAQSLSGSLSVSPALGSHTYTLSCSGVGGSSSGSATLTVGVSAGSISVLAGQIGGFGNVDGAGMAARFNGAYGVTTDSSGNVYVADYSNHAIRQITSAGVVTTFAGTKGVSGSANGTGTVARFLYPGDVATDSSGNVYVADAGNCAIRKITSAGLVSTLAGSVCGYSNGTGPVAQFRSPGGVTTDVSGNVYVADRGNHAIRKVTSAGVVTTLAGGSLGSANGTGSAAQFTFPSDVATDSSGNVYVADTGNNVIRKITPAGVVTTLAGRAGQSGSGDGTGINANFNRPSGVATDSSGNVYVADSGNYTIRQITSAGVVTTLAGSAGLSGSTDGTGTAARFSSASKVATDSSGNVYVGDSFTVRKIMSGGVVTTLAGMAAAIGSDDGMAAAAKFSSPSGVATDSNGNIYIGDHQISMSMGSPVYTQYLRKISPSGVVMTLASFGGASGPGAGRNPIGLATDNSANIYVANLDRHIIQKFTPGGSTTILAGSFGATGSVDGTGAAARFNRPSGVVTDSSGNVYVADCGNYTIRKVTPAGVVTTLAGSAGMSGLVDGTGAAARFGNPSGVAIDSSGNVYVADYAAIRKVTPTGVVTTLAGGGGSSGSADGTGSAAQFDGAYGIAVDSGGNVYVADTRNHTIRKITPAGVVTTIVGQAGLIGVVPGPLPATLSFHSNPGLALSGDKTLFVTGENAVIRIDLP